MGNSARLWGVTTAVQPRRAHSRATRRRLQPPVSLRGSLASALPPEPSSGAYQLVRFSLHYRRGRKSASSRPLISFTARRNSPATSLPFDAHLEIRPAARVDILRARIRACDKAFVRFLAPFGPSLSWQQTCISVKHGSTKGTPGLRFGGRVYPPSLEVVREAFRLSVGSCCRG